MRTSFEIIASDLDQERRQLKSLEEVEQFAVRSAPRVYAVLKKDLSLLNSELLHDFDFKIDLQDTKYQASLIFGDDSSWSPFLCGTLTVSASFDLMPEKYLSFMKLSGLDSAGSFGYHTSFFYMRPSDWPGIANTLIDFENAIEKDNMFNRLSGHGLKPTLGVSYLDIMKRLEEVKQW